MALETEYRGYLIRYSENGDEWTCYDIGSGKGAAASTLSKMKERIDTYLRGIRKESAVPCLEVSSYSGFKVTDATLIEYLGPKIDGGGWEGKPRHVTGHKVAAMAQREGKERPSRQERSLNEYAPLGSDAELAIAEAQRLKRIADDAEKAYRAAVAAIPRLAINDVAELVRISGIDPSGGIKSTEGVSNG